MQIKAERVGRRRSVETNAAAKHITNEKWVVTLNPYLPFQCMEFGLRKLLNPHQK
jgi:hypothetical protein